MMITEAKLARPTRVFDGEAGVRETIGASVTIVVGDVELFDGSGSLTLDSGEDIRVGDYLEFSR